MDPDRHPDLRRLRPLLGGERALEVGRRHDGVAGALEDEKHAVSCPIDLVLPRSNAAAPDELADPRVHLRIALAEAMQKARRALEVGEEQRHGPVGSLARGEAAGGGPVAAGGPSTSGTMTREGGRARIVTQDLPLELMQRRARVEAEPVDERDPALLVDREGVGLPPGPVERQHQEPAQRLPQRVLAHEGLELPDGHGLAAAGEIGLEPELEGRNAQPLQPANLVLGKRLVLEVRKRRTAPEPERLAQHVARLPLFPFRQEPPAPVAQAFEALQVEGSRLDLKTVPRGPGLNGGRTEQLPQLRDVHLDHLRGGWGRMLAPELVHDPRRRDDLVDPQQEHGEERSLLRAGERELTAVVPDRERS